MNKRMPILGALVLTPLLLSGCTSSGGSAPDPSPTQTFVNSGAMFDAPAQVELPKGSNNGVFLPKGMAFFSRVDSNATPKPVDTSTPAPKDTPSAAPRTSEFNFQYKQYDGQGDGWNTPLTKSESANVLTSSFVTSWKGKKYVVAVQSFSKNTDRADSISKGVQSQVTIADVLDPETGKLIKTIRNELANGSSEIPTSTTEGVIVVTETDGEFINILFDPTNGSVSDERPSEKGVSIIGSANGKFVTSIDNYNELEVSIPNGSNLKGVATHFGKVIANKVNDKGAVTKTTVVLDGTTGKQIASLDCNTTGQRGADFSVAVKQPSTTAVKSSPNGRYLTLGEVQVFDTETGKGFCGVESEKQKAVKIATVDNDGNAYGTTSEGYFKINVESGEVTGVDTNVDNIVRPSYISEDGWGVFPLLGSAEKSFAVPPKK